MPPVPVPPAVLTYVVPGLVWPSEGAARQIEQIALPHLRALLSGARVERQSGCSVEVWLANQFGLADTTAVSPFRLLGETNFLSEEPDISAHRHWLCADPVSMRFAREHLLLTGPDALAVSSEEAIALVRELNGAFADVGRFYAATPDRWYLGTDQPIDAQLFALSDVIGRPVAYFQPEGPNKDFWARLSNELQVFCHNHPVNQARDADGRMPLNALWLWGASSVEALQTPSLKTPARQLSGDDVLLAGLAHASHVAVQAFDPQRPCEWNLVNDFRQPSRERDFDAWSRALVKIDEEVFAHARQLLKMRAFKALRICAPGDATSLVIDVSSAPAWQFWRRPLPAKELAQHLSHRA